MSLTKVFGHILQELRKEKGLSQQKLSELCNLDRSYISMLERGLRQPTLNTLFVLGKNLEIRPSLLVQIIEERNENKD